MRVLITGGSGQDGQLLAQRLSNGNDEVLITSNRFEDKFEFISSDNLSYTLLDITDENKTNETIANFEPDVVFHLAGITSIPFSLDYPQETFTINLIGTTNLIQSIHRVYPGAHLINAVSTEIYGRNTKIINENSSIDPVSPYAISKAATFQFVKFMRESKNFNGSNAILANHESRFRSEDFVTGKIAASVARIYLGMQSKINLGNLDTGKDWSAATDFIEGLILLSQQPKGLDLIFASGKTTTVRDLLNHAFKVIDITDWDNFVEIDSRFVRKNEPSRLQISPLQAKRAINWEAKTSVETWMSEMVKFNIEKFQKSDASQY